MKFKPLLILIGLIIALNALFIAFSATSKIKGHASAPETALIVIAWLVAIVGLFVAQSGIRIAPKK